LIALKHEFFGVNLFSRLSTLLTDHLVAVFRKWNKSLPFLFYQIKNVDCWPKIVTTLLSTTAQINDNGYRWRNFKGLPITYSEILWENEVKVKTSRDYANNTSITWNWYDLLKYIAFLARGYQLHMALSTVWLFPVDNKRYVLFPFALVDVNIIWLT